MKAAPPPLSFPMSPGRGYGAAPPASRALYVAARRAYGPPLTPEPLRPLTAQRHGQEQSPCPPKRPALTTTSHQTKSLRFEGIATTTIWRHFLDDPGTLHVTDRGVVCALNLRSHHPQLIDAGYADLETPIPWWDNRTLQFTFPPR
ncbi:hypothetical protein A4G29_03070 [Mycobacterium kansasii]|nr:hypothetical protein A4G29_03070 [Mycobacterium kansasii]